MSGHDHQKHEGYWSNAKLCRLVQNYPCFYDRSHPQYLKKDVVDKSWAIIAKEVKDSVASCKERWRNIRTAFARSINIYRTPSGPNRTKRYYLHDELEFLAKHITPGIPIRSTATNDLEENENSKNSIPEDDWTDEHDTYTEDDGAINQCGGETVDDDYIEAHCPPRKRFRAEEILECKPSVMMTSEESVSDYDSMFLKGLLPEMKAMNFRQKIIFKRRIYQVIEELFEPSVDTSSTLQSANPSPSSSTNHSPQNVSVNQNQSPAATKTATMVSSSGQFPVRTITIQGPRNPTVKAVITSAELNLLRNLNNILNNQKLPCKPSAISTLHVPNCGTTMEVPIPETTDISIADSPDFAFASMSGVGGSTTPILSSSSGVPTPITSHIETNIKVKEEPLDKDNAAP